MDCPECGGKTKVSSTRKTYRWRKCLECGHSFRSTRPDEKIITRLSELAKLFESYGLNIRESTLKQLSQFSKETVQEYLDNADLIISSYQAKTGQYVNDHAGFIINAIITEQPIPYQEIEPPRPRQTEVQPEAAEVWEEIKSSYSHVSVLQRAKCLGLFDNLMIVLAFNDPEKEIIEGHYMDRLREHTNGYNIKIVS